MRGAGALLALLVGAAGCDGDEILAPPAPEAARAPFDHAHAALDALLARHVREGGVDYAGLAKDRAALDAYAASLAARPREEEAAWSREQRVAFWINAYNTFTLRLVLDHQPIASIREIGLLPFAAFRQPVAPMAARPDAPLSLDDIEKGVLLGELWDARVHFAVNCASASCPALLPRAWRADDLDATLDAAARAFLADETKNRWDPATRELRLSRIFEWYASDFERAAGSVPAYVARYAPPTMAAAVASGDFTVTHLDYDWSLNAR